MQLKALNKERLDQFLARELKQFSRSQIQRMIKDGAVKINSHLVLKPAAELRPGDRLDISEEKILQSEKSAFKVAPENIPLKIIYEDRDIVVVNKPAGMLTHPTPSEPSHTLANALVYRYPKMAKVGDLPAHAYRQAGGRQEVHFRPGIVHRLDKDTSGLIIAAKNQEAFLYMKEQFLKRSVVKKYLALIEGTPKEKEGVIEYAIRPSKKFRLKKVAVKEVEPPIGGSTSTKLKNRSTRAAKTAYRIKKIFDGKFTLLEITPLTGRTHQIRVHLSAIGHPVVGDRLYGSKSKLLNRQFLHAYYLKFVAPNGTPLALEIGLPEDLKEALAKLKS